MRLLVLSDIHSQETLLHNVLRYELAKAPRPDFVLFLGDGLDAFDGLAYHGAFSSLALLGVRGNRDFFGSYNTPDLRDFTWGNTHIVMTHGHRFEVKSGLERVAAYGAQNGADLVLFGHTHVQKEIRFSVGDRVGEGTLEKPLVLFNPGSITSGCYGVITLSADGIACEHKRI